MDLRVLHGGPQAGPHQLGTGGEHHVGALRNGLLHQCIIVFALLGVEIGGSGHLPRKGAVQLGAAKLMLAGPGGSLRRALMHKGHLEFLGLFGQNPVQQGGLLGGGRRRGGADRDGRGVFHGQHIIPHAVQPFGQTGGGVLFQFLQRIQLHQQEQHIVSGGFHVRTAVGLIGFLHPVVQRENVRPVIIVPFFAGGLAQQRLQFGVAAGAGELQRVQPGERERLHKFIVLAHHRHIHPSGHNAGHMGGDGIRPEGFQHTDPLVALLHVKQAHVLKAADGVMDAVLQMGQTQADPFGGKLGVLGQQWHEVAGKGRGASRRLGAHHQMQRHLHHPQRDLLFHVGIL